MRIRDWSSDVCSSDLSAHLAAARHRGDRGVGPEDRPLPDHSRSDAHVGLWRRTCRAGAGALLLSPRGAGRARHRLRHALRSEEHTSELQSLMRISYAVFCLKKKKNTTNKQTRTTQ